MNSIDALNTSQQQAVRSNNPHLLILAGAGSGKTRVLVQRIAWLIENQICSPMEILAVTFTNKAAKEMLNRTESMLNLPAKGLWVGTFHSISHRFLFAPLSAGWA